VKEEESRGEESRKQKEESGEEMSIHASCSFPSSLLSALLLSSFFYASRNGGRNLDSKFIAKIL
jgi:hypothetical protein